MNLIARLLPRLGGLDDGTSVVPPWVAPVLLALSVLLLPWIVLLFLTLPADYTAARWHLAWGGFDVGLAASMGATGFFVYRRSPLMQTAAAVTAALLVCDAWFDVLTSRGNDFWFAVALAVLFELPLAAVCIWVARSVERVVEDARPHLEAGGFTIRGRRLLARPAAVEVLRENTVAKTPPTAE